jgi:hypothetical protein
MEPAAVEQAVCARCGERPARGDELRPCVGCGEPLCGRGSCSRTGYENLARKLVGHVCGACIRRREIVPRAGAGKGAGSAAGVEAVERARYYVQEVVDELEESLRRLSIELAERISTVVEERLDRVGDRAERAAKTAANDLEAAAARQIDLAAARLGQALEDALARGLARGVGDAERSGRALLGDLGDRLRSARLPLVLIVVAAVLGNAALTAGIVLALR